MIELLNRRRMVTLIILLITLCVVVVIIEDLIADHETAYVEHYRRQSNVTHHQTNAHTNVHDAPAIKKPSLAPDESHKSPLAIPFVPVGHCWEKESFKVVDQCRVCFRAEAALPACLSTGYREHVLCDRSGDSFRPCHAPMRGFWYFELIMLGLAWFFNAQVRSKQELISKGVSERLQKLDCNV